MSARECFSKAACTAVIEAMRSPMATTSGDQIRGDMRAPSYSGSSTPTRSRTRNASLGPRHDLRFTIGAEAEGKGVEPLRPCSRTVFETGPATRIRLPSECQWTRRESNPHFQHARLMSSRWTTSPCSAVDRRGIAPRFPLCDSGVFLFDQQPMFFQRSRRESNPVFRHTRAVCRRKHLKTIVQ